MIFSQNSHREEKLVGVFMCGYWAEHLEIQIKLIKIHCKINFRNRARIPFPFQTKKKFISACRSEESVVARRFIIKCFRCRYLFLNLNNCGCFKDFKKPHRGFNERDWRFITHCFSFILIDLRMNENFSACTCDDTVYRFCTLQSNKSKWRII